MPNIGRPDSTEYASFYANYVANVTEDDVLAALEAQGRETAALLARTSEEKGAYRYEPDKWSVKQVLGHFVDAERIFAYRTLTFARGDTTSLPGFDQNPYVDNANFDDRPLASLAAEYAATRQSTVAMLRGLSDEAWQRRGNANNVPVSVRALAYITLGHERHHLNVLRERYGLS